MEMDAARLTRDLPFVADHETALRLSAGSLYDNPELLDNVEVVIAVANRVSVARRDGWTHERIRSTFPPEFLEKSNPHVITRLGL